MGYLGSERLKNSLEEIMELGEKTTIQILDSNAHVFLVQHTDPLLSKE